VRNSDGSQHPLERLHGSVERVTFHSEASGFCVLRIKVRGQRDLITVTGSAASVTPGEYIECLGIWGAGDVRSQTTIKPNLFRSCERNGWRRPG